MEAVRQSRRTAPGKLRGSAVKSSSVQHVEKHGRVGQADATEETEELGNGDEIGSRHDTSSP